MVEQRTENPCVGGSTPPLPINISIEEPKTYEFLALCVLGEKMGLCPFCVQFVSSSFALCQQFIDKCPGLFNVFFPYSKVIFFNGRDV